MLGPLPLDVRPLYFELDGSFPNHEANPLDPKNLVDLQELVRAAGGVPVMAHPFAGRRGRTVDDGVVAAMAAAGLFGLEADHRDHDDAQRRHAHALAADLGLAVTGSSDYHGTGKLNRLGELTTDPEVLDGIEDEARSGIVVLRP